MRARFSLWLLCLFQAVLTGGMALSFPFFALYLHRRAGIPMLWVGAWMSFVLMFAALSQGAGGELSDLYGRKAVMLGSIWGRTATALALAVAINRAWPLAALLATHFVAVFAVNFFDPAARGWVADHCSEAERPIGYSLLRIAVNAGWAIGPACGGFLAEGSYARLFFWSAIAGLICAIGVGVSIQDLPGSTRQGEFRISGVFEAAGDATFLRLCLFTVLIAIAMGQMVNSLSLYAADFLNLSEGRIGLLFSVNGVMVVFFQYALTLWWSRFRISSAVAGGAVLYAIGYGWVGFATGFLTMAAAVATVTVGEMIVSPGLHTLAANMAPAGEKGRYLGFLGFAYQFGSALAPLAGGLGLQYISAAWKPGHWELIALFAAVAAAGFLTVGTEEQLVTSEVHT